MRHRGNHKAVVAGAHAMLRAIYRMLAAEAVRAEWMSEARNNPG
jgi:hypothetical protein